MSLNRRFPALFADERAVLQSCMHGACAAAAALTIWALSGCTSVPPPDVLAQIDRVRVSPALAEAKTLSPAGFAHAEKLRSDANAAFASGDTAGAQILGERAMAAYTHATILSRMARAQALLGETKDAQDNAKEELASIDAEQVRITAEAEALELRVKVVTDAQPPIASEKGDRDREKARMSAARALSAQGRLLCGAAQLLLAQMPADEKPQKKTAPPPAAPAAPAAPGASDDPLVTADEALAPPSKEALSNKLLDLNNTLSKLESDLAAGPPAPIDQASRLRAGCLSVLASLRRTKTPVATVPGAGDTLLSELSAAGNWAPSRDDRGVFVTLRGLFKGDALLPAGAAKLSELGRVAAAHPNFPVLVVMHDDKEPGKKDQGSSKARLSLAAQTISAASGAAKIDSVLVGTAMPAVDPEGADRARNARIEVVFVVPETF